MKGNTQQRFPLAPLYELAQRVANLPEGARDDGFTTVRLARMTGTELRYFYRWRADGGVPIFSADRVACRLGFHLCLIWPEWFAV